MKLRTGRKVGRTIYVQHGEQPSDDDQLVGMMDTPALATAVVGAVNYAGERYLDLVVNTPVKSSDCDCGVRLGQTHLPTCTFMRKLAATRRNKP